MRLGTGLAGAALALVPFSVALAQTPPANVDNATLQQRLEATEQRLKVLERKLELQNEAASAAAASAPQVRASATRISIGTADGANFVRLRGVMHVDGRHFEGDGSPAASNTWLLRRVRPIVEGTVGNIFDFRFTPDFGGGKTVIQDAYVTARFRPWAAVTVGKFRCRSVSSASVRKRHPLRRRAFPTRSRPIATSASSSAAK
jgi:phosphate-selective porin OprO/OprP